MTSYSFVAGQNVTGTAPTGNATAPGNETGGIPVVPSGNVTDNQTTTAANDTGEVDTFNARGQIAGMISDEVLGGKWKIDVTDGEVRRVEVNMTMAKPDGSDFHTHLIDNFTAGGDNETSAANATDTAGGNMTGGNATAGNATTGNETTLTLPQIVIGGGNETGATGNATTGNVTGGNETGGNETTTAGAITLSEDGTFEISGTANIYSDDSDTPEFESVPITIESTGRVLLIDLDHEVTGDHFGGEPIYGFVTALIGEVDGSKESVLPSLESGGAPAAPAPTGPPMPVEPGDGIGPAGNASAPTGNTSGGNQTPAAPTAGQGGGGTQVSVTSGSSTKTDDAYDPNPVEVKVGDTVTWANDDTQPHTVTSGSNSKPDGKFDSSPNLNPMLAPGQTFEHTFE
ncbi:MAG: cupredoxin domain-containing protein, partial [Nitrososphaera sp.]